MDDVLVLEEDLSPYIDLTWEDKEQTEESVSIDEYQDIEDISEYEEYYEEVAAEEQEASDSVGPIPETVQEWQTVEEMGEEFVGDGEQNEPETSSQDDPNNESSDTDLQTLDANTQNQEPVTSAADLSRIEATNNDIYEVLVKINENIVAADNNATLYNNITVTILVIIVGLLAGIAVFSKIYV